jgi:hypothetical protein
MWFTINTAGSMQFSLHSPRAIIGKAFRKPPSLHDLPGRYGLMECLNLTELLARDK